MTQDVPLFGNYTTIWKQIHEKLNQIQANIYMREGER